MAIITVSRQPGSRGEELARELAARLGFELVTREVIERVMASQYGVETARSGPGSRNGSGGARRLEDLNLYGDLVAAIVADLAVAHHLVLVGLGSQFLLEDAPGVLHLRVVGRREERLRNLAAEEGLEPQAAAQLLARQEAQQASYVRALFRRSPERSDAYHLVVNVGALGFQAALDLALEAVERAGLRTAGLLPRDYAERLKLHSRARLARHLARRPDAAGREPAQLPEVRFAHPSERVFARLMDFYRIDWQYEPRTFPIRWDDQGNPTEAFTPDFYLPELDLYVELTTMKQSLVRRKNRKLKRLREIYPGLNVRIFYQKDIEDLVFKLGSETVPSAECGMRSSE